MARWHRAGLPLEVSINVSANYLQSAGFISKLQQQMVLYPDLPPHQLQIEILETAALHDIAAVSDIMRACATIGVDFALANTFNRTTVAEGVETQAHYDALRILGV